MLNQLANNMMQPTSNVTTCTWGNDGKIKYPQIYSFTFTDIPKKPFKLPGTYDCPSCMKHIKTYCDGMAELGTPIDEDKQCRCRFTMGSGVDLSEINSLADLSATITRYDAAGFYATTTTMTKFMGLPNNPNFGLGKIDKGPTRPPKSTPKYRNHWLEVIEEKKQMKINFDGRKDSDWELDV
jgi:hypothetical protein